MKDSQIDQGLSARFANMALLCACLVVFIHLPKPAAQSALWFWAFFSAGIAKIAVPFFFVAAGFFLAGKFGEEGWYKREVLKRVKTLLIPLLIWNVIWTIWWRSITIAANLLNGREYDAYLSGWSVKEVLRILALWPFEQPALSVLWFVRVLFLLVLFSPLLKKISTLPCLALIWILHGLVHPDYGVTCTPVVFTLQEGFFSLFGMTFFCLGIYLRSHQSCLTKSCRWALLVGCALLLLRGMPHGSLLADRITWLSTPLLMAGIWSFVPARPVPRFLAGLSFPIYVLHRFFIFLFVYLHLFPSNNVLSYVGTGAGVVVLCVFGARLFKRCMPRVACIAFGGR